MEVTFRGSTEAFLCHQSQIQINRITSVLLKLTKRIITLIEEAVLISMLSIQEKLWQSRMRISSCLISSRLLTCQEWMAWTSFWPRWEMKAIKTKAATLWLTYRMWIASSWILGSESSLVKTRQENEKTKSHENTLSSLSSPNMWNKVWIMISSFKSLSRF